MPEWLLVLILIAVGFILLLIELLIIPGFGFTGLMGLLSLVVGSYIAYTKLNFLIGLITSLGSLVILILCLKLFPKTGLWKKLRLEKTESKKNGFHSSAKDSNTLIGKEGVSLTPLRPTGIAVVGGRRIDVVTEGIFLPKDTKIKVINVEGNRIVVRKRR